MGAHRRLHMLSAMSDDDRDRSAWVNCMHRIENMKKQWLSSNRVENFRLTRTHSLSEASRQDYDAELARAGLASIGCHDGNKSSHIFAGTVYRGAIQLMAALNLSGMGIGPAIHLPLACPTRR